MPGQIEVGFGKTALSASGGWLSENGNASNMASRAGLSCLLYSAGLARNKGLFVLSLVTALLYFQASSLPSTKKVRRVCFLVPRGDQDQTKLELIFGYINFTTGFCIELLILVS